MAEYEGSLRPMEEVRSNLLHIRDVMDQCVERGIARDGFLPGNLQVRRRAHGWQERLNTDDPDRDPAFAEDWVNLVALAVNEENAAGGRVVTAPTNGAAGIIPAVLYYARNYCNAGLADPDEVTVRFLLTAGAIGSLYKDIASVSGAEVGCQGEVGSAASMAAAGLAEVLGGTPAQVENAAEIAMEHSLGLTCDPIGGLVQIPCIERNAISAGKAINAARMALRGDGHPPSQPRRGDQHHARRRLRHEFQVQGDRHRRSRNRRQRRRVLTTNAPRALVIRTRTSG
jgi:L-serine dehydratase